MESEWINALIGGMLIGLSVSLMLIWNGRVVGISGIINQTISPLKSDNNWRVAFLGGLIFGGIALHLLAPQTLVGPVDSPSWTLILAGLLVGFGTTMGGGCTSGHGVCGISRMSLRSILATVTFIAAGVLSVALFRAMGVLP